MRMRGGERGLEMRSMFVGDRRAIFTVRYFFHVHPTIHSFWIQVNPLLVVIIIRRACL